jgi:DNA-binding response OmpR family regulator
VARILLVDDDPSLLDVLSLAFAEAGHDVLTAKDGAEGLATLERDAPHVAIVDVNLPRLDGFSLVRRARERGASLPILMLTSRDDEVDEALGLELGADDYVPKPFSLRVLLARVQALLRREEVRASPRTATTASGSSSGSPPASAPSPAILVAGPLAVDPERMEVRFRDVLVPMTVTELRLLEALARRPGYVFSRDRLLELARGDDSVVGERIVDTYVRRLRRKLEAVEPGFDRIETVVGAGYRWKDAP